jgi:FkbM family methyltransferase
VTRNDWDPNMARALRETLTARPGANVIDVGAWVGTATLLAGVLGAGKVLALEPDPLAFEELWANVRHNPDLAQRTWVYRHCASDRSETVSVTSVVGSTAYLLGGWDAKSAPAGEGESTWSAPCSTIPALAAAHGLPPESVGLLRISAAQPGMELYIGKTVLDWAMSTPPGAPKPGIWLTLHTHKWGDKTLGASCVGGGAGGACSAQQQ